jgi:hypothetical protein
MKIRVRLSQGLEAGRFPEHDHLKGMELRVPDDFQVKDLFNILKIQDKKLVNVVVNGKVKKWYETIEKDAFVDLFLRVGGG